MKLHITPLKSVAVAASLLGLCPALFAQSATNSPVTNQYQQQANRPHSNPQITSDETQNSQSSTRASSAQMSEDPRGRHASELIGLNILGRNGETLGELNDFVVDSKSGKVVYDIVSSGGVLGVGRTLRAVPFSAVKLDTSSSVPQMTADIDQARWNQAPLFKKNQVASLSQDQRGREIFQFYGQKPPSQGSQQLALTSSIIGRDVYGNAQTVGEVEDVIVQLQSGTAAALLDPNNDFAGTDQKYLIPLNKLTLPGPDTLTTTLSRRDFASAKVSSDASWARSDYGSTLYVWPSYTATEQGGARRGEVVQSNAQAPVEAIRDALQSDPRSSRESGIISIVASGDRVILGGTVQSEDMKQRIGDRAKRAAQGWDIENQIRVAQEGE